ncbi:hypothetical protein BGZ54_008541 [Gamsiella multidivaricata]|nr:hypothetical protein BGZ54_008541 [Gamsiella multidivaricata]
MSSDKYVKKNQSCRRESKAATAIAPAIGASDQTRPTTSNPVATPVNRTSEQSESTLNLVPVQSEVIKDPQDESHSRTSAGWSDNPYIEVIERRLHRLAKRLKRIEGNEQRIAQDPSLKKEMQSDQLVAIEKKPFIADTLKELEALHSLMSQKYATAKTEESDDFGCKHKTGGDDLSQRHVESFTAAFIQLTRFFYTLREHELAKEHLSEPLSSRLLTLSDIRDQLFAAAQSAEQDKAGRQDLYTFVMKLTNNSEDVVCEGSSVAYKAVHTIIDEFVHAPSDFRLDSHKHGPSSAEEDASLHSTMSFDISTIDKSTIRTGQNIDGSESTPGFSTSPLVASPSPTVVGPVERAVSAHPPPTYAPPSELTIAASAASLPAPAASLPAPAASLPAPAALLLAPVVSPQTLGALSAIPAIFPGPAPAVPDPPVQGVMKPSPSEAAVPTERLSGPMIGTPRCWESPPRQAAASMPRADSADLCRGK